MKDYNLEVFHALNKFIKKKVKIIIIQLKNQFNSNINKVKSVFRN